MKLFGRPLQFSLATALLGVCFAGAVICLFVIRNPWHKIRTVKYPHSIRTFAINGDEKLIAIATDASADGILGKGRLSIVNFASEQTKFEFDLRLGTDSIQFNPTRNILLIQEFNKVLVLLDCERQEEVQAYTHVIPHEAIYIDGDHVLILMPDGRLDLRPIDLSYVDILNRDDNVGSCPPIARSSNGKFVVTVSLLPTQWTTMTISECSSLKVVKRIKVKKLSGSFCNFAFTLSDQCVAACSTTEAVLVSIESGKELWRANVEVAPRAYSFTDQQRLLIATGKAMHIHDVRSGKELTTVPFENGRDSAVAGPIHILRNGDIVTLSNGKIVVFSRRFPEWWWGHFYRVETWLAIVLGMVLAWRFGRWVFRRPKLTA
jgi:hypothetical protein